MLPFIKGEEGALPVTARHSLCYLRSPLHYQCVLHLIQSPSRLCCPSGVLLHIHLSNSSLPNHHHKLKIFLLPYLCCCLSAGIQSHRHPPGVLPSAYLPLVQHSQYKLLSPPSGPCASHATVPVASHWVLKSHHSPPKGLKHNFCYECAPFLQALAHALLP